MGEKYDYGLGPDAQASQVTMIRKSDTAERIERGQIDRFTVQQLKSYISNVDNKHAEYAYKVLMERVKLAGFRRRLPSQKDDVFAEVDVDSRIQQIELKRPKPVLKPSERIGGKYPMPKPGMKYRPKEMQKYSVRRRLVKGIVASRIEKYEKLSRKKYTGPPRPKMVMRDANPIPSTASPTI